MKINKIVFLLLFGILLINLTSALNWQDVFSNNNNLIRYYPLNESSGTNATDMSRNLNGNFTIAPIWAPGLIGNAAGNFSGTSSPPGYFNTSYYPSPNLPLSISVWLNGSNIQPDVYILGMDRGDSQFDIVWRSDKKFHLTSYNQSGGIPINDLGCGTADIRNIGYLHFALVYNLTDWIEYINGTQCVYPRTGNITLQTVTDPVLFYRGKNTVQGEAYIGFMDEIGMWNRTLNQTQIIGLYNGGSGLRFVNLNSLFIENSQTFNSTVISGSSQSFFINMSYNSAVYTSVASTLNYNGTAYPASITSGSGDNLVLGATITIPNVNLTTNNSFYWNFTFNSGVSNFFFNSSSQIQSVSPVSLSICGGITNTTVLNFTIKEEGTFNLLNASLQAELTYADNTQLFLYQNSSENTSNYQFCSFPPSANLVINGVVSYAKSGYDPREYWFTNATITNSTQNINLYLATTASTDTFTLSVVDEADNQINGAYIYVQRWDIGTGNFYTVGVLKTGDDGSAIINLRLTDAWYRYTVVYNDQVYLVTTPQKETGTSRSLRIYLSSGGGVGDVYSYFDNIAHSLTWNNNTNTFNFVFADTTGSLATGCLNIYIQTVTNSSLISSNCISTPAGSISYVAIDNGTYIADGILVLNTNLSSTSKVVDNLVETVGKLTKYVTIGRYGYAASIMAIGTAALIGGAAGSIPLGLFLIVAVSYGIMRLGLIDLTGGFMYILISIVILIVLTVLRRRQ